MPLRCTGEPLNAGSRDRGLDPPARHRAVGRRSRAAARTCVPATVVRQVFLGDSRDYMVELADGTQLRVVTSAGAERRRRASRSGCICRRERCRALVG